MQKFCIFQAIAASFACDQKQYDVILITHSAHEVCSIYIFINSRRALYISFMAYSAWWHFICHKHLKCNAFLWLWLLIHLLSFSPYLPSMMIFLTVLPISYTQNFKWFQKNDFLFFYNILEQNNSLQSLSPHLLEKHVEYCAVSSPPVLSADKSNDNEGLGSLLTKRGELSLEENLLF